MCVGVLALGLGAELVGRVGEEADLALAELAGVAHTRAVPGRVEPVLEDTVGELTGPPLEAAAAAEGRTGDSGVVDLAGVATLGLLTAVGVGALRPVVASRPGTALHFVRVHAKLVRVVNLVQLVACGVIGEIPTTIPILDSFQHVTQRRLRSDRIFLPLRFLFGLRRKRKANNVCMQATNPSKRWQSLGSVECK